MIIPKINSAIFNFNTYDCHNCSQYGYSNFGLKLLPQLNHDTVSFKAAKPNKIKMSKATKKALQALQNFNEDELKLSKIAENVSVKPKHGTKKTVNNEEKKDGVNGVTAQKIRQYGLKYQPKIDKFIDEVFGDLLISKDEPDNLLVHIGGRVKSKFSIEQKSQSRGWSDFETYIQEGTDLNGKSLILRASASKADVSIMLDRLIPYIRSKKCSIIEIENKRPAVVAGLHEKEASKYDYAYINKLMRIINIQDKVYKGKRKVKYNLDNDFTDGNYSAIHMLIKLPGVNVFELPIYGSEVSRWKHVDDVVWKHVCGKEPDPIYKPAIRTISSITDEGNEYALGEFNRYRNDGFLWQREKELLASHGNKNIISKKEPFLTIDGYSLDPEYSYKNIEAEVLKCDRKAEINRQNLEKANIAREENQVNRQIERAQLIQDLKNSKEK